METPLPSAEKIKSLNVEESRTKRLERQQARLRDRGGIFRPANRNSNLFDVLVQATHRKSPAKGRGRSRSRSVSPQKKAKTAPNKAPILSASKRKYALKMDVITESAEDDTVMQPRTKNSKGKQKRVSGTEVDEVGNDLMKSRPQSKKAMPRQKKDSAPRRRTKSTAHNEPSERKLSPVKAQKTKSKGRQKKTDVDEGEVVEIPLLKKPPPGQTKSKSVPQTSARAERDVNFSNKHQSQDKAATALPGNDVDEEKPIKMGRPSKKAKVDRPSDPLYELVVSTKPRSRKRKVEHETLDIDAIPPLKRRAPLKSHPALVGVGNLETEDHTPVQPCSTSQDLEDTINSAQPLAKKAEERSDPQKSEKKQVALKEASRSGHENVGHQPRAAPRAKRKRSQALTEVDDEPRGTEVVAKKPKTAAAKSKKDVLQPKATGAPENKESPCELRSVKDLAKPDGENGAPKTVSRKRKENAAVGKATKTTSTSKNKTRLKGGPRIPPHVKKKLSAQHNTCLSDDEPDPIDFLS